MYFWICCEMNTQNQLYNHFWWKRAFVSYKMNNDNASYLYTGEGDLEPCNMLLWLSTCLCLGLDLSDSAVWFSLLLSSEGDIAPLLSLAMLRLAVRLPNNHLNITQHCKELQLCSYFWWERPGPFLLEFATFHTVPLIRALFHNLLFHIPHARKSLIFHQPNMCVINRLI